MQGERALPILDPESIGKVLDRAVTISIHIAPQLGIGVVCVLVAEYATRLALSIFVFSHLFGHHFWSWPPSFLLGLIFAQGLLYTVLSLAISAFGIMASAVMVDDFINGVVPELRGACIEAFGEYGRAMLLLARYLAPIVLLLAFLMAGGAVLADGRTVTIALGAVLLAISASGTGLLAIALGLAWVDLVLAKGTGHVSVLNRLRYLLQRKSLAATALAVVTILLLSNAADLVPLGLHKLHAPVAIDRIAYFSLKFVGALLAYTFVTSLYLELLSRREPDTREQPADGYTL